MINDKGQLIITWDIADVINLATDRGREKIPTRAQAMEVLEMADKYHDCCMGISWDVLDVYLDEVMGDENE